MPFELHAVYLARLLLGGHVYVGVVCVFVCNQYAAMQ